MTKGGSAVTQIRLFDPPTPLTPQDVVDVWNANCVPLPTLRGVPRAGELRKLIDRAAEFFATDRAGLARAVRACAEDPFYRDKRLGFGAFIRHVDRWDRDEQATGLSYDRDRAKQRMKEAEQVVRDNAMTPFPCSLEQLQATRPALAAELAIAYGPALRAIAGGAG